MMHTREWKQRMCIRSLTAAAAAAEEEQSQQPQPALCTTRWRLVAVSQLLLKTANGLLQQHPAGAGQQQAASEAQHGTVQPESARAQPLTSSPEEALPADSDWLRPRDIQHHGHGRRGLALGNKRSHHGLAWRNGKRADALDTHLLGDCGSAGGGCMRIGCAGCGTCVQVQHGCGMTCTGCDDLYRLVPVIKLASRMQHGCRQLEWRWQRASGQGDRGKVIEAR
jgi:hypothetical protein